jgi:hypothetical protein
VPHPLRDAAVGGLGRHFHHVAFDVEFPAVIEAAQPAFLIAPEDQRGTPVRAIFVEHPDAAAAVAEHHQILAQQAHLDRRAVGLAHLLRQAGGDPMAAHDLPHRRIAFDAAQEIVLLGGQHAAVPNGGVSRNGRAAGFARPCLAI